jgi:tetratricopeptide (TPR) repeat protein
MISRLIGLFLALVTAATLSAQSQLSGDGRQAVEKSGIALVKPQKWSKASEAVPMRFTAYTNRGGYFVFRTPSGQERQVWVDQIVGGGPLLNPEIPTEIVTPAQRNVLQDHVDLLKQLVVKVPSAKIDIEQFAKPLTEAVRRYDAGEVRISGLWDSASKFRMREFYLAENQLQKTIDSEADKSKFDLENNSLFKQLVELSQNDTTLQAKVEAIRVNLQKQIAVQHRAQILDQLNNPNTSDADAAQLVSELKAIKNHDEKISGILEQDLTARALSDIIENFKREMDGYFAGIKPDATPQKLPAELELRNKILSEQIEKFHSSAPPAAVRIPVENARALSEISTGLPKLSALFEQRNYSEAATVLSRIMPLAARIGPRTEAVFVSLKTAATKQVDLFTKLRSEGEVAEKEGNTKEAIAKYSAALEISPNADLSAKIEQLKTPAKK